jgi:hypothetical protein
MNTRFRVVAIFFVLLIILTACTMSVGVEEPQPSSSPEQIGTIVAPSMEASTPEVPANLLPHSLYFLGKDSQALGQVYRIERDGKTRTQLTFESIDVTNYDVSLFDGSIAFVSNHQLLLANADGSNRRVVVDGADHPVFSRDGQALAYYQNGINLYTVSTGASNLLLEDKPLGGSEQPLLYLPVSFSPDGTRLLINMAEPPDGSMAAAIYSLADKSLIQFVENPEALTCCNFYGGPTWSADSSTFYGIASLPDSSYKSGELWKVDAASGAVTKVIVTTDATMNLPKELFSAPDGQLYYFFGSYTTDSGLFDAPTLQLVRSAAEEGAVLIFEREENFAQMNEALWAPDASFVIVALGSNQDVREGGSAEIVYLDGLPNVPLVNFAQQMKWGP